MSWTNGDGKKFEKQTNQNTNKPRNKNIKEKQFLGPRGPLGTTLFARPAVKWMISSIIQRQTEQVPRRVG